MVIMLIQIPKARTSQPSGEIRRDSLARFFLGPLAGVANRRKFLTQFEVARGRLRSQRQAYALLIADVDHCKAINDSFGHQAGNLALSLLSNRLDSCVRNGDSIGRIGGEKFAILLADCDPKAAAERAESIKDRVATAPLGLGDLQIPVTISIGGVAIADPRCSFNDAYSQATRRLYRAKQAGRNRVQMEDPSVADED
ncbi:GGDEF domain-containing protein [Halomonas nitroreducens]|uniref:diguanylate cyclase n=1 Tax=Halomonas nitroreducens TaxID=447425 RepID=A0A3S0HSQ9_9GAMM|nr:GGDEF domain-containing protein [Halomonas nitroreducens]RTR02399.1 GGDEF domain-containing protein [Halomonas nitroreducens]